MPTRIQRRLARSLLVLTAFATLIGVAPASQALPLSGQLSFFGSLALNATTVTFLPLPVGNVTFALPSTGSFAGLPNTPGLIANLNVTPGQVGTPLSIPNVLAVAVFPGWSFELTTIHPGAFGSAQCGIAPAAGQTCTPALSPALQLFNGPTAFGLGSTLSFAITGRIQDGADLSDFTALVTAQFPVPFQNVLATIAGGGTIQSSFSATLHAQPVPEPSTLAMLGLGVVAVGAARRRGEGSR